MPAKLYAMVAMVFPNPLATRYATSCGEIAYMAIAVRNNTPNNAQNVG
jgi:hypothetical protein